MISLNFHSQHPLEIHFKSSSFNWCLAFVFKLLLLPPLYCALFESTVSAQLQREREREKINKTILNVFLIEKSLIVVVSRQSNKVFFIFFLPLPIPHENSAPKSLSIFIFFLLQKENFLRYRFFSLLFAILFILFFFGE